MPVPQNDKFGFRFWLGWIFWFALSFLAVSALWTLVMKAIFGKIQGSELAVTWAVSVFGSWFLLIVPFMRKKEQIWKRLNYDEEKTLNLWLPAITCFVLLLALSALFWCFYYKSQILTAGGTGFHRGWLKAVIASWLVIVLPFLIILYKKADQIYKMAAERQLRRSPVFRTVFAERTARFLPPELTEKLKFIPPTMEKGHVVKLLLKDGRVVEHAFILNGREILGIYDWEQFDFTASDVKHLEPVAIENMPLYEESKWLRLDGRG